MAIITCDKCGKENVNQHGCSGLNHVLLCQGCFAEEYVMSAITNRYVLRSHTVYSRSIGYVNKRAIRDGSAVLCPMCEQFVRSNAITSRGICWECHQWNRKIKEACWRPGAFNFMRADHDDDDIFLGVEFEVDNACGDPEKTAYEVSEAVGDPDDEITYFQEDSTVTGFEFTTHPFTLKYHLDKFNWDAAVSAMADGGMEGSQHTGMHVHVGRSGIIPDDEELYRFVNYYASKFKLIAMRTSGWARFTDPEKYYYYKGGRDAINVGNSDTVEFRIFQTVLDGDTVRAMLETCHAIVEFLVDHSWNSAWEEFVAFVAENYYYLPAHMETVGAT